MEVGSTQLSLQIFHNTCIVWYIHLDLGDDLIKSNRIFSRKDVDLRSRSPVRYFDDVVCELHALEGHGLPLHACAGTINKSLEKTKQNKTINELKGKAKIDQSTLSLSEHSPYFGR